MWVAGEAEAGLLIADRFRVEALLGRGAIAGVHRVRDEQTGRRVALKLLRVPRRREGGLLLSQFEREFHTLCQLAHPRIIEVYDYGVLDGSDERAAFYTMELLDGQDLRDRGPLPWREACAIVRDVASSLAILHSRRLLHRDVSARNVRCTSDGRAKLIDFGAMAPVGVAHQTFGTPPFVPPEAMQQQALDARADLYSLGALSYLLLTGRHAYPARRLDQLGDVWQTHPPRVRAFAPEVPEALDRLVMQLLHRDRMVRPATAAEVMERLAGIADLPLEEPFEVTRAYLATPPLIGRKHALSQARTQLAAALTRQRGRSLLIEGVAGVGRTRFLDACVLEAKLLGAAVLRADGSTNAGGEFGVARALCSQLSSSLPELARRCSEPWQPVLGPLLQTHPAPWQAATSYERRRLLGALRDVLLAVSRSTRLVIAVDDVEQIDDASAALLAMLSHDGDNRPLALLFTTDAEAPSTPALSLLREIAYPIALPPLSAEQTGALVRGVFGEVDHVVSVAERMHELSAGNPRWTMASCERLVERGVARYESGSWTLPSELGAEDLPESLSAALAARVQALAVDARDLAATLALTDPAVLPLDRYPALLDYADSARLYRALDALVTAGVLVSAGSGYRFAQREFVELCLEPRPAATEPERHARIARALEGSDGSTLLAHHLMCAGEERLALERLLELHTDPTVVPSSFMLALLERAVGAAERLALPARKRIELRVWLADNAAKLGLYDHFIVGAQPLLRELDLASGLADYRLLGDAMPPAERLVEALSRAQLRSEQASPVEGRLSPNEAIPQLARLCATFTSMATISQDVTLLEQLPSLAPLTSLSPALEIVHRLVQRTIDFQCGRYELAAAGSLDILARLDGPEGSGLDPAFEQAVRLGQYYVQGVLAAARGQPSTSRWTEALARNPGHRVNAWRVRMTDALMQGDVEAAEACRRRAELLQLEDGGRMTLPGTTYRIELLAFLYAEDVMGVKRATERLEGVARLHPGWQPTLQIARASYRLLQGDPAAALDVLLPTLAELEPGRHMDWAFAASMHVVVLTALGRTAEAIECGREYLVLCEREQLAPSVRGHLRALSNALAAGGRLEEAKLLADRALVDTQSAGARGLLLGISHETRARVAAALHDVAGFRYHAERCAAEFHLDRNLALRAKYERLLLFARAHGAIAPEAFARARTMRPSDSEGPSHEVRRRLSACTDAVDRAGVALALSLEATSARAGWLFGLREGRLQLMAGTGEAPSAALCAAVDGYLKNELENAGATTMLDGSTAELGPAMTFDEQERRYEPLLVFGNAAGRPAIAAVAVLQREELAGPPRRALLEALGTALLECDDADPVTWLG